MPALIDRESPAEVRLQPWRPLTRIGFRLAVVYFTLYAVVTHIAATLLAVPGSTPPPAGLGPLWPMSAMTSWVAVKIFGDASPLVYRGNSRDTNFFWAEAVWVPIAVLLAAGLWSVLDRRREHYTNLHKWFRLFMRFAVAAQMFYFGVAKVIPTQFPPPSLITLSTRVGDVPLHGLFWTTIGMSPVYEMFLGWVEVLGGLLLLTHGTTMLGVLVSAAGMVQVFLLISSRADEPLSTGAGPAASERVLTKSSCCTVD